MSIKHPPTFADGDDYRAWKQDVSVWRLCTKEEKAKQAPQVYPSLKGAACEAVRGVSHADLVKEDGFERIIAVLDKIYLKDEATEAYCAFRDFVEYRRSSGETFSVFFVEFEKRYREVEKHEMTLPSGVKAYFLLQAANLTSENERLARTTAKLEFKDMKEQIQKIFGDNRGSSWAEVKRVKAEEVFMTQKSCAAIVNPHQEEAFYTNRSRSGRRGFSGRRGSSYSYSRGKLTHVVPWLTAGSHSSRGKATDDGGKMVEKTLFTVTVE